MIMEESDRIEIMVPDREKELGLPYSESGVRAGFPSPAEEFMPRHIDLNRELIQHPASTFYARVCGESMSGAGIGDGDLLVIDRAVEPYDMCIAVCFIDGEFTLKHIKKEAGGLLLLPANPKFRPIRVSPEEQFTVWGVVRYVIKKL